MYGESPAEIRGPFFKLVKYGVIHHTEVAASMNSHQLNSVDAYHRDRFGDKSLLGWWVGYNWFCDVDGTLTQTRMVGEKTAAQLAHNFDSESICFAGNFDKDLPTEAQIKVLRDWIINRPNLKIIFHRDLAYRGCPGKRFTRKWLELALKSDDEKTPASLSNIFADHSAHKENDRELISAEGDEVELRYLEIKQRADSISIRERVKLELILRRLNRLKRLPKDKGT
ncbi:MAG: peptidoglycan recognition family protein [Patescibacteria group bacterium]